jgi:hypothetical protein
MPLMAVLLSKLNDKDVKNVFLSVICLCTSLLHNITQPSVRVAYSTHVKLLK